jgi:hypothetical protein
MYKNYDSKSIKNGKDTGAHWSPRLLMETREGLSPDLSVEMEDSSIGKESRCSQPDYNHLETLHLSNQYTNSRGWHDLVEHDDVATRAPVLQAIEELADRAGVPDLSVRWIISIGGGGDSHDPTTNE